MKTAERKNTKSVEHARAMLVSIANVDKSIEKFKTERDRQNGSLIKSLRSARLTLGYSTAQIAKRIGVTQGYYADIERGRRSCTPELTIKLRDIWETL